MPRALATRSHQFAPMRLSGALAAVALCLTAGASCLAGPALAQAASGAGQGPVQRAVALRQAGEFEKAAVLLLERLSTQPEDALAHHELGILYAMHGQLSEAKEQFISALRINPGLAEARQSLAEVLRADERCAEALIHYKKLTDDDADRAGGWQGQILCHAQLGQWQPALGVCDAVQRRFPGTTLGQWAEARCEQVRAAMQSGDLTVGQMDAEGKALFGERRYADAAVWLAMAVHTEPSADRSYRLAMALLGAQDLIACQGALHYAISVDPNHQPSLMAVALVTRALRNIGGGGALAVDFGRFEEVPEKAIARALVEGDVVLVRQLVAAALPVKPAAGAEAPGTVLMLLAGEVSLRDNQYQKAREWFDKVLKAQPNHDAARKASADVLIKLGRFSDARRMAGMPPPPAHIQADSDLQIFVELRRAEVLHQLRMALDPGLRPRASLVDQVAAALPPPPPIEPEPQPDPSPQKGKAATGKGAKGKAGKGHGKTPAKPKAGKPKGRSSSSPG